MGKKNNLEGSYEVLDFTRRNIIGTVLATAFLLPLSVWCLVSCWDNIIYPICAFAILLMIIYALLESIICKDQMIFYNDGFIHLKQNRITGKKTTIVYRWDDIQYIRGHGGGAYGIHSRLLINYKKKLVDPVTGEKKLHDEIPFIPSMYKKIAELAVKYSGRKNIVKPYGYRPFEKG